jgi:hypothetical protein
VSLRHRSTRRSAAVAALAARFDLGDRNDANARCLEYLPHLIERRAGRGEPVEDEGVIISLVCYGLRALGLAFIWRRVAGIVVAERGLHLDEGVGVNAEEVFPVVFVLVERSFGFSHGSYVPSPDFELSSGGDLQLRYSRTAIAVRRAARPSIRPSCFRSNLAVSVRPRVPMVPADTFGGNLRCRSQAL